MYFKNSWGNKSIQWDKIQIKLRISFVTIFHLDADLSRRFCKLTLLNFSISNKQNR